MLFKYFLKETLFSKRIRLIQKRKKLYQNIIDLKVINKIQIEKFNFVWEKAFTEIPFYTYWKKKNKIPSKITSLKELQYFPYLKKKHIVQYQDLIFNKLDKTQSVSTGGSSGEPTKFPASKIDFLSIYADAYVARGWYGIDPFDKILSFWGHSHLFGYGFSGRIREIKRSIMDLVINTKRLNAYDMHPYSIINYYNIALDLKPQMISGYASCIFKLAQFMTENRLEGTISDNLKVVIPTSETISINEKKIIEKAFRVPVAIEYGMAETGIIAHSNSINQELSVFWDSFLCNLSKDHVLITTTLYNKLFPLINYFTQDVVNPSKVTNKSLLSFKSIKGRIQEEFKIRDNNKGFILISGILIVHILKSYEHIYSVQAKQLKECSIQVYLTSNLKINIQNITNYFIKQLMKNHKNIDASCIKIKQVKEAQKSISGKENIVWNR